MYLTVEIFDEPHGRGCTNCVFKRNDGPCVLPTDVCRAEPWQGYRYKERQPKAYSFDEDTICTS